jgi:hypothetical protein
MICYRTAAACVATVRAEATARQVNIAPSPVSGNCSPTVTALLPLCMSLAADPMQARRHKTKSRRRIRTGSKRKISESVTFQAPMCMIFNMSPDPPVGTPLSVHAPLEPIKGRARTLELKLTQKPSSSREPRLTQVPPTHKFHNFYKQYNTQ